VGDRLGARGRREKKGRGFPAGGGDDKDGAELKKSPRLEEGTREKTFTFKKKKPDQSREKIPAEGKEPSCLSQGKALEEFPPQRKKEKGYSIATKKRES